MEEALRRLSSSVDLLVLLLMIDGGGLKSLYEPSSPSSLPK